MEQRAKRLCCGAFWLMLLASPFLDMINGIWTYFRAGGDGGMLSTLDLAEDGGIGPSLAIRLVFLALMVAYLLISRHKKAILMFVAIGCAWVLSFAYEFMRGESFSVITEVQYMVRFCYSLVCLVVCERVLKASAEKFDIKALADNLLCVAALTAALGVLVPYLFEMGFYTYADPLGYRGSRGFYYAGNDITVVIMLIMPLMLCAWMECEKPALWDYLRCAAVALSVVALLLIGTKTAFMALIVIGLVMSVYALIEWIRKKNPRMLLRCVTAAALAGAVFLVFSIVGDAGKTVMDSVAATEQYAEQSGAELVVFNGRLHFLRLAWVDFREALPISIFVGTGRAVHEKIIEMDIIEVFVYYGVFGLASMLWLYLTQGIKVVIDLFRAFSLRNLACCTALALCVGFLVLAGHVLFSVTSGFYFAFMIGYTRLVCSREGLEAKIL